MSDDTTRTLTAKPLSEEYLATLDPETREFFELMTRDEPVHPDLMEYYEEDGPMGPQLRHPLVYEIGIMGPARINLRYEAKKKERDDAHAAKDWFHYVWTHERPYRLQAFLEIASELKSGEYWELMRDVWVDSENIWQHSEIWSDLFENKKPGRSQFMTAEERKLLRKLPDELQVFRGCQEGLNDDAHSWTLDRERAEWFAKYRSFGEGAPVVLTALVPKKAVIGYVTTRSESEIVVADLSAIVVTRVEHR